MTTSVRPLAILAVLCLLFMLPRAAKAADPCKLLTADEIAAAIGNSVSPTPLGTTGCMWKGSPQYVSIVLRDASAWPRIIMPGGNITKTDVSGIGDAASFSGMGNIWTLSVKQGNSVIVLTVYNAKTPGQQKSSEQTLAKLALKHL